MPLHCGAWASHCGDFSTCRTEALGHAGFSSWRQSGSVVVAYRLSCSSACVIFPDQKWNLWQADSYPLYHQGILRHLLITGFTISSKSGVYFTFDTDQLITYISGSQWLVATVLNSCRARRA